MMNISRAGLKDAPKSWRRSDSEYQAHADRLGSMGPDEREFYEAHQLALQIESNRIVLDSLRGIEGTFFGIAFFVGLAAAFVFYVL